jgi:NTP pyrophosphatase (non-canonical NTP hydrolase)
MDIARLTKTALQLHDRFAANARRQGAPEWTRDQIMQGFVVDVGALMKLVMAKDGLRHVADVDRKLGHELADCLWSVLVLAKLYDVNLEHEFTRMVAEASDGLRPPRARSRKASRVTAAQRIRR